MIVKESKLASKFAFRITMFDGQRKRSDGFLMWITDIYATAVDYSLDSRIIEFFLQPCRTKSTTLSMETRPLRLS